VPPPVRLLWAAACAGVLTGVLGGLVRPDLLPPLPWERPRPVIVRVERVVIRSTTVRWPPPTVVLVPTPPRTVVRWRTPSTRPPGPRGPTPTAAPASSNVPGRVGSTTSQPGRGGPGPTTTTSTTETTSTTGTTVPIDDEPATTTSLVEGDPVGSGPAERVHSRGRDSDES